MVIETPHLHTLTTGAKCADCGESVGVPAQPAPFGGGAISFAQLDQWADATAQADVIQSVMAQFSLILDNIRMDDTMSDAERAQAIADLSVELQSRIADAGEEIVTTDPGSMTVFKDLGNDYRWVAVHSNRFFDRQKEVFPEYAHRDWVRHVWATKEFPALRLWHVPVDIGRADFVDYDSEGFVVSSGHFNAGMDDVAERLSQMKDLGCSHGFLYRKNDLRDGVYHAYRSYEITALPRKHSANTLTAFFAGEEVPMLDDERKEFLVKVMGPERVSEVERGIRELATVARDQNIAYKEFEERLLGVVGAEKSDGSPPSMEKCPECDADIAPDEMAAHMADEHPGAGGKKDAPEDGVADSPVTEPHPTEPAPSDAPVPTAAEVADAAAAIEAAKAITTPGDDVLTAAFKSAVAPLLAQISDMQAEIAGLKAGADAAIASAIRPRVGPDLRVEPSSMSASNVVPADDVAALKAAAGVGPTEPPSPAELYVSDLTGFLRGNSLTAR